MVYSSKKRLTKSVTVVVEDEPIKKHWMPC